MDDNFGDNVFPAALVNQFVPLDENDQNDDYGGNVEVVYPEQIEEVAPNHQDNQPMHVEQDDDNNPAPNLVLVNHDPRVQENQEKIETYVEKHATRDQLQSLLNSRLLVICLPKLEPEEEDEDDNSFEGRYERFLRHERDMMFTLTQRSSPFLLKLRQDPTMRSMYDFFIKDVAQKVGSLNDHQWIAEVALCYIMYTHMHNDGPRYEFFFDLSDVALVTRNIILYFDSVKQKVIELLPRLKNEPLFCIGSCREECLLRNDAYHFSLTDMHIMERTDVEHQSSRVHRWTFFENEEHVQSHALKDLLLPPTVNDGEDIIDALSRVMNECQFNSQRTWHTYILLVVKDSAMAPNLDNLKEIWERKLATFGVYVGCTVEGKFRQEHLKTEEEGGTTAVSKFIDEASSVFLVTSLPFSNKTEALNAEARLIGLTWYERFMKRRNMPMEYELINVRKEHIPLGHNTPEQSAVYKKFMASNQRLFRFRGEPVQPNWITESVLQTYLVDKQIK